MQWNKIVVGAEIHNSIPSAYEHIPVNQVVEVGQGRFVSIGNWNHMGTTNQVLHQDQVQGLLLVVNPTSRPFSLRCPVALLEHANDGDVVDRLVR